MDSQGRGALNTPLPNLGTIAMQKLATIQNQAETVISTNPYLAQQSLQLEFERGRLVLRGVVKSFFQKQMAQEAVRHVDGVDEIENQLEVSWM